jgi:hypothetical protein
VIDIESIAQNPNEKMSSIFRYLGVDDSFASDEFQRKVNVSASKMRYNAAGRALRSLRQLPPLSEIGLPEWARALARRHLRAPSARPTIKNATRGRLAEFFAPEVDGLRRDFGLSLENWSL